MTFTEIIVSEDLSPVTLTIYASMISAAPCEMFWMGGNTLRGAYSGVGPENRELLGP